MITQEELKEILHYDPETGTFRWAKDLGYGRKMGDEVGTPRKCGTDKIYYTIWIDGKNYYVHRLAYLYMKGEWPSSEIDHRDNNGAHNQWSNLRIADRSQQQWNSKRFRNNKSGIKGVYWYKKANLWRAEISVSGKRKFAAYFKTKEEAEIACIAARKRLHGKFGRAA